MVHVLCGVFQNIQLIKRWEREREQTLTLWKYTFYTYTEKELLNIAGPQMRFCWDNDEAENRVFNCFKNSFSNRLCREGIVVRAWQISTMSKRCKSINSPLDDLLSQPFLCAFNIAVAIMSHLFSGWLCMMEEVESEKTSPNLISFQRKQTWQTLI